MNPLYRLGAEAAVLVLLCATFWWAWVEHDHTQQAIGTQQCEDKLAIANAKASKEAEQQRVDNEVNTAKAQKDHADEIRNLPVHTTPIFVHVGATASACPNLPGVPDSSGLHPASGADDAGSGTVDVRPAINAFELRYETALADARLLIASWPKECYTAGSF